MREPSQSELVVTSLALQVAGVGGYVLLRLLAGGGAVDRDTGMAATAVLAMFAGTGTIGMALAAFFLVTGTWRR